MKRTFVNIFFFALVLLSLSSCRVAQSGSFGSSTDIDPYTKIRSINEYDLNVAEQGIEYTIDYSTPEGQLKLKKISLSAAKELVNAEAAMKYNCAMIVRPKYTFLKDGKQILRITVFGFPANYKNAAKDYVPLQNRHKTEVDVNVNR